MSDDITDCVFCRIVSGTIPAALVASNEEAVAFHDNHKEAPVHILVVPREHLPSLAQVGDPAVLGQILALAAEVARNEGLESGYRVVINTGENGGQTVQHLHAHVLGGRKMAWPPG